MYYVLRLHAATIHSNMLRVILYKSLLLKRKSGVLYTVVPLE